MDAAFDSILEANRRRKLARLAARFFLAAAALYNVTIEGDVLDMVIFLTINRANRAKLTADPAAAYAQVGLLPDSEKQPISVNGVATWLDLPFETTRRHIRRMRDRGLCEIRPRGVIIPTAAILALPRYQAFLDKNQRLLSDLVRDTRRLGAVLPEPRYEFSDPPIQLGRMGADFLLEAFDTASHGLGLTSTECLIFRAITFANVEPDGLDPSQDLQFADLTGLSKGQDLRPVTVYALSKSLMLPYETMRRHIWRLVKMGLVEREKKGFVVRAHVAQQPEVVQAVDRLAILFGDFVATLAEAGVGRDASHEQPA